MIPLILKLFLLSFVTVLTGYFASKIATSKSKGFPLLPILIISGIITLLSYASHSLIRAYNYSQTVDGTYFEKYTSGDGVTLYAIFNIKYDYFYDKVIMSGHSYSLDGTLKGNWKADIIDIDTHLNTLLYVYEGTDRHDKPAKGYGNISITGKENEISIAKGEGRYFQPGEHFRCFSFVRMNEEEIESAKNDQGSYVRNHAQEADFIDCTCTNAKPQTESM